MLSVVLAQLCSRKLFAVKEVRGEITAVCRAVPVAYEADSTQLSSTNVAFNYSELFEHKVAVVNQCMHDSNCICCLQFSEDVIKLLYSFGLSNEISSRAFYRNDFLKQISKFVVVDISHP